MAQLGLFRLLSRPWNTGRMIGPKPPLKPKHIWAIRNQLRIAGRTRDLALFNCAIDAKLRGCDLLKLRLSDVGRPVPFEIAEPTREPLVVRLKPGGSEAEPAWRPHHHAPV